MPSWTTDARCDPPSTCRLLSHPSIAFEALVSSCASVCVVVMRVCLWRGQEWATTYLKGDGSGDDDTRDLQLRDMLSNGYHGYANMVGA